MTCMRLRELTARFPGSVHGDFDGAVVGGHLRGSGEHGDGQSEALSCSKATRFIMRLQFKARFFFLISILVYKKKSRLSLFIFNSRLFSN